MRVPPLMVAVLLLGCGSPDLSADLVTFEEQVNDVRDALCSCPDVAGYPDVVACDEAMGRVGDTEQTCMDDALASDGQAGLREHQLRRVPDVSRG